MTRREELLAMVAELDGKKLFIDPDGDACLAPPDRDMNLVALPGRDDDGSLLRPDAWAAMVDRFNTFPTLATEYAAALAEIERLREVIDATADYLEDNGQGQGRACHWLRAVLTQQKPPQATEQEGV